MGAMVAIRRVQAMGQLDLTCTSPTARVRGGLDGDRAGSPGHRAVAAQVDPFEQQILKPFLSFYRLKG
jgi:hypothetical protein